MKPFRCLPHGKYTLIPTILTTLAWLSSLSQDGCDYARITGPMVNKITISNAANSAVTTSSIDNSHSKNLVDHHNSKQTIAAASKTMKSNNTTNTIEKSSRMNIPFLEVGLSAYRVPKFNIESNNWEIDYRGDCLPYETTIIHMDDAWNASKMFAFLGLVLGGGGSIFLWISSCCIFSPATWRWAGYEILLAFLFQMLSFSWFLTDICNRHEGDSGACSLGWGSKTNIFGSFCWGFASFCIFCKYPSPKISFIRNNNHLRDDHHDHLSSCSNSNEFNDANEDLKNNDEDDDMSTLITVEAESDDVIQPQAKKQSQKIKNQQKLYRQRDKIDHQLLTPSDDIDYDIDDTELEIL